MANLHDYDEFFSEWAGLWQVANLHDYDEVFSEWADLWQVTNLHDFDEVFFRMGWSVASGKFT